MSLETSPVVSDEQLLRLSREGDREAFRPWLLRIVVNQTHNTTRARSRARNLADRAASWHNDILDDEPAMNALTDERRKELIAALGALRAQDREVLARACRVDVGEGRVPAHRADRVDRVEDGGVARCLGEGGVPGRQLLNLLHLSAASPPTAFNLPPGTVKSRAARGLARLRHILADQRVEVGAGDD